MNELTPIIQVVPYFVIRVAEHRFQVRVKIDFVGFEVPVPHSYLACFCRQRISLLAFLKRVLHPNEIGYVSCDLDNMLSTAPFAI